MNAGNILCITLSKYDEDSSQAEVKKACLSFERQATRSLVRQALQPDNSRASASVNALNHFVTKPDAITSAFPLSRVHR